MLTSQNHRTPESIHEAAIKFKTSTPINVNTLKPGLGTEHWLGQQSPHLEERNHPLQWREIHQVSQRSGAKCGQHLMEEASLIPHGAGNCWS